MATCDRCLWYDQCASDEACEHFSPSDDDEHIEDLIDQNRYEFYEEWSVYTGQTIE